MKGINFKQETLQVNQQVTELSVNNKKLFTKLLQLICKKNVSCSVKKNYHKYSIKPSSLISPPPPLSFATLDSLFLGELTHYCHWIKLAPTLLSPHPTSNVLEINKPLGGLRLVFPSDGVWVRVVNRSVGTCIVIGLSFCFYCWLQQFSFN